MILSGIPIRDVFKRLGQSTVVMWLVWLVPLPLLLPFLDRRFWQLFAPMPFAVVFFIPALIAANTNRRCFSRSGDDRVKPALATVDLLIMFGFLGMAGMLVFTGLIWLSKK